MLTPMSSVRILFLAANPAETSRLALDEEMHAINQRLRSSGAGTHVELCAEWALRADELPAALMRHRPRIVHFSGHGSSSGELFFVGEQPGTIGPVSSQTLHRLFQTLHGDICCVVLNACYSALQATALATVLPCVVGMSRAVQDRAATAFAAGFYEALVFGESVKTAFSIGCAQIELAQTPDERDVPQMLIRTGVDADKLHLIPGETAQPAPTAVPLPPLHVSSANIAPPLASREPSNRMAKLTVNQKKALGALAIATLGCAVIAAIKVIPSFRADPPNSAPDPISAPSLPAKSLTSSGNNSPVINAEDNSTVTVGPPPDPRVGNLLERGLPKSDHPVVNPARPMVVPSFRAKSSSSAPTPTVASSPLSKSLTSGGNNSPVINAERNSTVTVVSPPDPRVGNLLERGLPESDHPVVNLARPIEEQIQVFPEDKIEVVGWSDRVEAIWLGNHWETVTPNSQRVYTVWGPAGEPVTPKFRGQGEVKLSISFTKNRDKPRDLRDRRPYKPVLKE